MSLGKGLESLIPPNQSDGNNSGQDVNTPVINNEKLEAIHEHIAPKSDKDPEPQILSFDFAGSSDFSEGNSGNENSADVATPAVAAVGISERQAGAIQKTAPAKQGAPAADDYIFHIEVSKIKPNPNQPRRNFDENALWELAKSIREFGFLQPLVVTRHEKETNDGIDVEYELIAGERRLMAAKLLGLEYVPAIVRNVDLEREKLELAVIENIQREDLNPVERGRAFQRLQEEFRLTQREIASKLGKSRETVANTVRLLDLPMYIQEALEKAQITESHGRFLLQISDPAAQKKLFDDIVLHGLTTRDLKNKVRQSKPKAEQEENETSPELKALEEKLTMELGTPVKIERGANTGGSTELTTGKITITFYSEEELRNIVERFGAVDEN